MGCGRLHVPVFRRESCAVNHIAACEPIRDLRADCDILGHRDGFGDAWLSMAGERREHPRSEFSELHDSSGHDFRVVQRSRVEFLRLCDEQSRDSDGHNRRRTIDAGFFQRGVPEWGRGNQQHNEPRD